MKKLFCLTLLLFVGVIAAQAQDIITKKNGDDIKAKVLEVTDTQVKYKIYEESDGPTYTINKSELAMITYQSGRRDTFSERSLFEQPSTTFNTSSKSNSHNNSYRTASNDIRPGMKYKELKKIYSYSNYQCIDESFNPALSGVCSFLIPGLGQAISGDIGRGFGWFLGSAGCGIVMGVGASMVTKSISDAYHQDANYATDGKAITGSILLIGGAIALTVVDICAIVDAVRVAKVTNMYKEDLRNQRSYSLHLQPSFKYIPSPNGAQPTAGFTLAMTF